MEIIAMSHRTCQVVLDTIKHVTITTYLHYITRKVV